MERSAAGARRGHGAPQQLSASTRRRIPARAATAARPSRPVARTAGRLCALRQYGWTAKYESTIGGGRNSRLDEVQAAILRDRLPLLDRDNARRREIARRYSAALAGKLAVPPEDAGGWVAHRYTVRTPRRDELREFLAARGIRAETHYPIPDHRQPSQRGLPARSVPLPETERKAGEVLSLPCFPELEDREIETVIAAILEWRR